MQCLHLSERLVHLYCYLSNTGGLIAVLYSDNSLVVVVLLCYVVLRVAYCSSSKYIGRWQACRGLTSY